MGQCHYQRPLRPHSEFRNLIVSYSLPYVEGVIIKIFSHLERKE